MNGRKIQLKRKIKIRKIKSHRKFQRKENPKEWVSAKTQDKIIREYINKTLLGKKVIQKLVRR